MKRAQPTADLWGQQGFVFRAIIKKKGLLEQTGRP